ncbi:MAG: CoA transferase [Oscillospiraceae bacterium]|nr:CoA transferase [Oscillospiraceae bacterium]
MENIEKIRVLDLSTVVGGPFAAAMFADFGAEVIKVEMPGVGDPSREMNPAKDGIGLRWNALGRNKKTVTLDLHQPEAKELFLKLVGKSDVIIENFRVGTLEKWGLGMDKLRAANPDIIVTHVTGYGQTGPYKDKSGFGNAITGYAGPTYITGFADRRPVNPAFSLCDYLTGLFAMIGSLVAIINKKSQEVDASLYESMFRLQEVLVSNYYSTGTVMERGKKVGSPPGDVYESKDGKFFNLACSSSRTFRYLMKAMDREDLAEKYPTMELRTEHEDELIEATTEWCFAHTYEEIAAACDREKAVCVPIFSIVDIWNDEHFQARGNIQILPDETFGTVAQPAVTPRLSETPGKIKWTGRAMGEFNHEIFCDLLGLSETDFEDYKARKII